MKYLTIEKTDDKIAIITIDCPGSKVNKVSSDLLNEISATMEDMEKEELKGVVIVSGKDDNFIVGADLDEIKIMKSEDEIRRYITTANDILIRLEKLPFPVVCAIHGNCLGGGLELALVTDYRIASNSTKTVFGFPEVMLGLMPAAGGNQRLPRLIGLKQALPLILAGRNIRTRRARRLGLIDEIVDPHGLKEIAVQKVRQISDKKVKIKRKRRALVDFLLESNPIGRGIVFSQARKMVMRQTHGLYPAPLEILESISYGFRKGVAKGLKADIDRFVKLVLSPQSRALVNLFFGMTQLKKNPMKEKAKEVKKLAVIGTGLMGSGIAAVSADICDTILMKDVSIDAAARGLSGIWKGLEKQVKSGSILPFDRDARYGKLVPCDDYSMFTNTDIVIEAVFEDILLKKKVLGDVEASTDKNTIFASNTSALPIQSIAEGCRRPENVIGMHYFSPVPRMPLLEIIKTEKTSDWVTATALEFGIMQGKTCIVVKDGPGFYTTRILAPLLTEACEILMEGADMHDVDRAMHLFGYPVGPITLLDEVGIDVGVHVIETLKPIFKDRSFPDPGNLSVMTEKKYFGRKTKIGMYRYDVPKKKGMRQVNTDIYKIFGDKPRIPFPFDEIQRRVSLMMVNEALICLQEGIISSPRDGDLGAILGLGFPPFRGGPFRYIDTEGAGTIADAMKRLAEKHGKRFSPAEILLDMAAKGSRFYKD